MTRLICRILGHHWTDARYDLYWCPRCRQYTPRPVTTSRLPRSQP